MLKLSENFISQFKGKQPNWGFGDLSYFVYKRCVDIDTPVLKSDFTWAKAGDLKVGEKLIAFDEFPQAGKKRRYLQLADVTHNIIKDAECVEIELEDGTKLYSTPDHSWLARTSYGLEWVEARNLTRVQTHLPRYLDVWSQDNSRSAGYFAGAMDSEASLDRTSGLDFAQCDNEVLEQVTSYLDSRGVIYSQNLKSKSNDNNQDCFSTRIYGLENIMKLLGSTGMTRLATKLRDRIDSCCLKLPKQGKRALLVQNVRPCGVRQIAVLSTSAKTHFTDGFASHNTYARQLPNGAQEEYWQTCQRVVEGVFKIQFDHCNRMGLPWQAKKAQSSAQKMFRKMWEFKFTPPGRGLWVMGSPIVDKLGSAALCNCGFVSTKDIRKKFSAPFTWAMDMLMLGVGIGFDAKGAGDVFITAPNPAMKTQVFVIPDTREGWVEAMTLLIDSYDGRNRWKLEFDCSLVRKAGEPIKGFGGTASGPQPLMDGLEAIRSLLDANVGKEITSIVIVDMMNFIGKLVVSGNIRRSAEVAIGEEDDLDFIQMKDPDLFPAELSSRRWASNNSIFATPESDFDSIVKNIMKNGEPGLVFLDNARHYGRLKDGWNAESSSKFDNCEGANPCVEQFLYHLELCNLVETYPANHDSYEEYQDTLKYAYLYAKSVTLLPTHNAETNQVMLQNRRIGLSMSGVQQALKKFGSAKFFNEFCDQGYDVVSHWDRIYSRWLGIPTSLKKTTLKPSGTVSLLAGATPGVHCTHSEFYLRAIRFSATSPLLLGLLKAGYRIEFDVTDKDKLKKAGWTGGEELTLGLYNKHAAQFRAFTELGGTLVVYFPVKETNFTKSKADISIWEQLCLARELQDKWSDNSVSITVTFKDNEFNDLKSAIEYMAPYVKSLSFLPLDVSRYAQMPYTTCTEEAYEDYSGSLKRLRLASARGNAPEGERYCSNDICEI